VEAASRANLYCLGYKSANSKQQDISKANCIVDDFNAIDANFIKEFELTI